MKKIKSCFFRNNFLQNKLLKFFFFDKIIEHTKLIIQDDSKILGGYVFN